MLEAMTNKELYDEKYSLRSCKDRVEAMFATDCDCGRHVKIPMIKAIREAYHDGLERAQDTDLQRRYEILLEERDTSRRLLDAALRVVEAR
jgi:hypothetical protein